MFFGELEGTGFETLDSRFEACLTGHSRVERLWTGARWLEGPAWFAAGRFLLISDIPNNRILRWDETDGSMSVFRNPSNFSNGNAVDHQGRLVTCEHLTRRVTRTEHDGSIQILTDTFERKRLNSPNDVVIKSDASIWFTDPSYGLLSDYEGSFGIMEQEGCYVYRLDPITAKITTVATSFVKPNGLAFNNDESALFVSDTGFSHDKTGPKHIRKLIISLDGKSVSEDSVFSECQVGLFDGFRLDCDDRIWTSAGDGVHCYSSDGTLIGKILIPEIVANVCFGSVSLNRLFIAGTTSLYSVFLNVNGLSVFG
jgi:gluconolactonase